MFSCISFSSFFILVLLASSGPVASNLDGVSMISLNTPVARQECLILANKCKVEKKEIEESGGLRVHRLEGAQPSKTSSRKRVSYHDGDALKYSPLTD